MGWWAYGLAGVIVFLVYKWEEQFKAWLLLFAIIGAIAVFLGLVPTPEFEGP